MFARGVREGESLAAVEGEVGDAWKADLEFAVRERIQTALAANGKALVLGGVFPPLNLTLPPRQLAEQYDTDTWKVEW